MTDAFLLFSAADWPLSRVSGRRARGLRVPAAPGYAPLEVPPPRGCHSVFQLSRILRLRRFYGVPRLQERWTRKAVLLRDGYQCIYCGKRAGDYRDGVLLTKRDFTIDHILPRSRGGPNTWANTACACACCNHKKAARLPHEAGMRLRWEPKAPRTDYLVLDGMLPHVWKAYVETAVAYLPSL